MAMDFMRRNRRHRQKGGEIFPEEIFLDSHNQPAFDRFQLQGRLERPIGRRTVFYIGMVFAAIFLFIGVKVWFLQIHNGEIMAEKATLNTLRQSVIFPARGIIVDSRGETLVSNRNNPANPDYPDRVYDEAPGLSALLGYVSYPKKDSAGFYTSSNIIGRDGIEELFDGTLAGLSGAAILETDALSKIVSSSVVVPPRDGTTLKLSIDSRIQTVLFSEMAELAKRVNFQGGAGVIMDVQTGELLASATFPEFSSTVMTEGEDSEAIGAYQTDFRKPFLDRVADGLYAPGSIVKPFMALAALEEGVISPEREILSTGSISIPNPYDPDKKSIFRDWRAHGLVDMRQALAVSSDVYFYEIGGGFEDQLGLGIGRIEKYLRLFGFGSAISGECGSDTAGVIPNPEWKAENFGGDIWRVGDTYNTAIGQYGLQVSPMQVARAIAAIANNGKLLTPRLTPLSGQAEYDELDFDADHLKVVHEGMREAVKNGTAVGLNSVDFSVAAKTGTAEIGSRKQFVNSWVVGFFPYEKPRYAFALVMERGPVENLVGATYVMRQVMDWMKENTPEYLESI